MTDVILTLLAVASAFIAGWQAATTRWSRKAQRDREIRRYHALIASTREETV